MNFQLIILTCLLAISHSRATDVVEVRRPHLGSRIVGGVNSEPGQFPYQVSLQWGYPPTYAFVHFCGGTIITPQWIMTAAHCVVAVEGLPKAGTFVVKAGKYDLSRVEDTEQTSVVTKYIWHKQYNIKAKVGPYDIALLKLETPLRLNKYVQIMNLPKMNAIPKDQVVLSGWGAIDNDIENPAFPAILQFINLPLITLTECNRAIKSVVEEIGVNPIHATNICTGPLTGGISACGGDSGGPLVSKSKTGQTDEVVGIVSWGVMPCGSRGAPSVFVRVSAFIDWIENVMKNS